MNKAKELSSPIDKAVFDYNLIEDGDRILIGASGEKTLRRCWNIFRLGLSVKTAILNIWAFL